MSNVLEQTKQQQVLALGRLGWPASRIAAAARVDRATVTRLPARGGLAVRGRGRPSEGPAKAGNFPGGVHRPAGKSRNFAARGVHRLGAVARAAGQCVRAVSRADRSGRAARPQCDGDLAGPRRRGRLHRPLRECPPLRPPAPRHRAARGARRHRHHAGRGSAGRLRRGPDGPPSARRASTGGRGSLS